MPEAVVPPSTSDDSDDVAIALETARVQEERGDDPEAARWLQKAAVAARKDGRPERAGELSRAAARLTRESAPPDSKFEKHPDQEQVLSEPEGEFSDQTIVDSVAKLKQADETPSRQVLSGATPVAPGATTAPPLPAQAAYRVGVRRSLAGRIEARPLSPTDALATGEEEAYLLLTRTGAKLP